MRNTKIYQSPTIEIWEVKLEGIICGSGLNEVPMFGNPFDDNPDELLW